MIRKPPLESLSSASDNMKTDFDRKTVQLLNKTTAINDKLKRHSGSQHQSPTETSDQEISDNKSQGKHKVQIQI